MRILALELNNEYDRITGASGNASDFIEITASLALRDYAVMNGISADNSKEYLVTNDWLVDCIGY